MPPHPQSHDAPRSLRGIPAALFRMLLPHAEREEVLQDFAHDAFNASLILQLPMSGETHDVEYRQLIGHGAVFVFAARPALSTAQPRFAQRTVHQTMSCFSFQHVLPDFL